MRDSYGFSVVVKTAKAKTKTYDDWLHYLKIGTPQMTSMGFQRARRVKRRQSGD